MTRKLTRKFQGIICPTMVTSAPLSKSSCSLRAQNYNAKCTVEATSHGATIWRYRYFLVASLCFVKDTDANVAAY